MAFLREKIGRPSWSRITRPAERAVVARIVAEQERRIEGLEARTRRQFGAYRDVRHRQ